jgi:chromosome segregation and condensation protein ScpB
MDNEISENETEALGLSPEETPEEVKDVDLNSAFEAILFLSNEPVPISFFVKNFEIDATEAKIILDSLLDEYAERDGGIKLVEISGGFQFVTNPKCGSVVRKKNLFQKECLRHYQSYHINSLSYLPKSTNCAGFHPV